MGTAIAAAVGLGIACALWVLVQRRAACAGGDPAAGCHGRCGACGVRARDEERARDK